MLVIRMQRTGRKGHAQFRVVVQDSRRTPTSGKIVASLGHVNPHTKETVIDKEKASFYLEHGAQPSDRAARMLKSEGVKLPDWVKLDATKAKTVRNADKRRSTRPAEPIVDAPEAPVEPAAEATPADVASPEETTPAVDTAETAPEEAVAEAPKEVDAPTEEAPTKPSVEEAPDAEESTASTPADK